MTDTEAQVRAFVAAFPGRNALAMLALCERGTITWAQAYEVARQATAAGLLAVGHTG